MKTEEIKLVVSDVLNDIRGEISRLNHDSPPKSKVVHTAHLNIFLKYGPDGVLYFKGVGIRSEASQHMTPMGNDIIATVFSAQSETSYDDACNKILQMTDLLPSWKRLREFMPDGKNEEGGQIEHYQMLDLLATRFSSVAAYKEWKGRAHCPNTGHTLIFGQGVVEFKPDGRYEVKCSACTSHHEVDLSKDTDGETAMMAFERWDGVPIEGNKVLCRISSVSQRKDVHVEGTILSVTPHSVNVSVKSDDPDWKFDMYIMFLASVQFPGFNRNCSVGYGGRRYEFSRERWANNIS